MIIKSKCRSGRGNSLAYRNQILLNKTLNFQWTIINNIKKKRLKKKIVLQSYLMIPTFHLHSYNFSGTKQTKDSEELQPKEKERRRYRLEKLLSEVTVILLLSRVTVTESPRAPALPPTLMRSWRNFSSEAMSMILSSTGLAQSMVKVAPFFLPLGPPVALPLLIASLALQLTKS